MIEEASPEFILKKSDERRNYLLDEIKHKDLMSEKYKKTRKYLNYVENLLLFSSTNTGRVSTSPFVTLVCIPVCITSSSEGIRLFGMIAGVKKYNSIIKKNKMKHGKIALLGQDKLNTMHEKIELLGNDKLNSIEVLILKALID